jgi:hypothetical protein
MGRSCEPLDHRLHEVIDVARALEAAERKLRLGSALRSWQPASAAQQDDITLFAMDVL